ncbi:MAG: hypothetical protein DYG89_00030 [Caldilinea sp. CFX5]|nr:hypothetical protein [Caldilinea sp. CFX5]
MSARKGCLVLSTFAFLFFCALPPLLNALIASPWRVVKGAEHLFVVAIDQQRLGEYGAIVYWQPAHQRLIVHNGSAGYNPARNKEVLVINVPARQVQWLPVLDVNPRPEERVYTIHTESNAVDADAPGARLYPAANNRQRYVANDYYGLLWPKVQITGFMVPSRIDWNFVFHGSRRLQIYPAADAAPLVELRQGIFDGSPSAFTADSDMTWLADGRYLLLEAYTAEENRLLIVDAGPPSPKE